MPFYIYILHMAVGIVVGKLYDFSDLFLRSIVILIVSIAVYELCYLSRKAWLSLRQRCAGNQKTTE